MSESFNNIKLCMELITVAEGECTLSFVFVLGQYNKISYIRDF